MTPKGSTRKPVHSRAVWLYALALVAIALLYYCPPRLFSLPLLPLTRRAAVRVLFILPIAGATFVYGQLGGWITLIVAVLIMLPRIWLSSAYPVDATLEVLATAGIGSLVVWMIEWHRRNVSRLRAINAVATVLTESLDLDHILNRVLDTLLDVLDAQAGAVYLVRAEEQGLTLAAHRNLPADLTEGLSGLESARKVADYDKLGTCLAVPIRSKEQFNGLVLVGHSRPRAALRREEDLITTICNQINVVVENTRLYQEIARQFEIESSVYEVVDEITSELELERVLPKVIAIAERLVGADSGLTALWDEERNLVTYPYLHNLPRRLAHVTVPKEVGLSAEVMLTGQPLIIDDYPNYARAIPEFVQAGVKSIVGVPIVNRDRTFGTMAVMTVERQKSFSERDVAVLTGIGRQAGIAVENAYLYENLRYYARRITQAQENERKRIARELHDDTIQSLIALSRRLEGLATGAEQLPNGASSRIRELWEQTGEMVRRVREFSQNLRPSVLDDLGLLPTLEELTLDMKRQVGLETEFRASGERRRLSSEVELTLFRIAQEALSNIRRHARATKVTTTVELADTAVRMRIEDDGIGFRPPKLTDDLRAEDGLGLIGMHERVRLLGGSLRIESEPGRGTAVIAEVPV
jgi:signal transduction histidine kinase